MVVDWATALIKAAPFAARLAANGARGFVAPWWVAFTTRKRAKKEGLGTLRYGKLRRYLSGGKALEAINSADPERYHELGRDLVGFYVTTLTDAQDAERQVVEILLYCYTRMLSTNQVVELQSSFTAERIGMRLEERDASRYVGDTTFEQSLQRLSPHRAEEARELASIWPGITQFVHEFVHAADRVSALESWHASPPSWFQSRPSDAIAWFARIANDYGLREIAVATFDDAIRAGATPLAYWRTRQTLTGSEDVAELAKSLAPYAREDPVARAIVVADADGPGAAAADLREWEPQSAADQALKQSLLSQLVAPQDLNEAVAVSGDGFVHHRSASCGCLNSQYLIHRGSPRRTALEYADLERALEAALKARDAIRLWDGPASRAVELAIIAARLLGRTRLAWTLARTPPDGAATPGEAESEGVRREAATMAAQTNMPELARELAAEADLATKYEVEGLIALFSEDKDKSLVNFQSAVGCASTEEDLERLALQVALHGVRSPRLVELHAARRDTVEEIELIADACGGSAAALSILRTRSRSSRVAARALIGLLIEREDTRGAALLAEQAGANWSDPEFDLLAAEMYLGIDEFDSAIRCADEALRVANSSWENALRAHNVKIQAHTIRWQWAPAAKIAMDVLAADPGNTSAVWVLVLCQHQMGQPEQAWKTYTEVGRGLPPRNEHEACIRVDLWRRFERDPAAVQVLTAVLGQFPDSRQVKTEVAKALILLPLSGEDALETVENVRSVIAPLLEELRDVFVQKEIDQDDPIGSLDAIVSDLPDTSEQDQQVERGRLPLGMAATMHRRSLTEVLACRSHAPVFSGDSELFESEVNAAADAMNARVIVDTTALYALSMLDETSADQLLGCFLQAEVVRAQLIDAIQGVDSLANLSTLRVGRASDGSAVPVVISSEEAETRYIRAQQIRAQFDKIAINDSFEIRNFPELRAPGAHFAWLAATDCSITERCALWCDDRATRRLASARGVSTFSTHALLRSLRQSGAISGELAFAHEALLIARYFVGLGFRDDWLQRAAEIDGWRAAGAASFVAHCGPTTDPAPVLDFVMRGVRRNLEEPESLRGWVAIASYWLVDVAGTKDAAQANLVIFLGALLGEPWLESSNLPFVLQGVRDGIGETGVGDPLWGAFEKHYRLLAEQAGWAPAAQRIRDLVALADRDDRVVATAVVLQVR
ncbi:hypothetical protein DE4585_04094 [Mycobacteroides salmoniphilum]|uniref:PIN domain-containing protein n=1 Tax=Mycobacteroides salmoniphilum TaxID=404941 RepID=A0A4R8RUT2_9MYCO|nr:hypothetical protein DE4585_04094 [Mycobacteroides salmoniphilum]